jgi:hypothetical protein
LQAATINWAALFLENLAALIEAKRLSNALIDRPGRHEAAQLAQ